jgi:hypothetical protein
LRRCVTSGPPVAPPTGRSGRWNWLIEGNPSLRVGGYRTSTGSEGLGTAKAGDTLFTTLILQPAGGLSIAGTEPVHARRRIPM